MPIKKYNGTKKGGGTVLLHLLSQREIFENSKFPYYSLIAAFSAE